MESQTLWDEAGRVVIQDGPWAALAVILLLIIIWLVHSLIVEGRTNRESQDRNTEALHSLKTFMEVAHRNRD